MSPFPRAERPTRRALGPLRVTPPSLTVGAALALERSRALLRSGFVASAPPTRGGHVPLLQALVDLGARDPQQLRRAALVPARLLERGMDRASLELRQRDDLLHAGLDPERRRTADERGVV